MSGPKPEGALRSGPVRPPAATAPDRRGTVPLRIERKAMEDVERKPNGRDRSAQIIDKINRIRAMAGDPQSVSEVCVAIRGELR